MKRKRITQRFPWLLPLRTRQRRFCFYLKMSIDGRKYCNTRKKQQLPVLVFKADSPLYNRNTGCDMLYQENKVFNLKLAAAAINQMLIRPGETFSFCKATRNADKKIAYKKGLTVMDGKLTTTYGGGLCQLTNLLFWLFLHSPLTIVERHGHKSKEFPEPSKELPIGVDATMYEGWLDLKVQNNTDQTFQIQFAFDQEVITGRLFASFDDEITYKIENRNLHYRRQEGKILEEVDVIQKQFSAEGICLAIKKLYQNKCEIGYALPETISIQGKDNINE